MDDTRSDRTFVLRLLLLLAVVTLVTGILGWGSHYYDMHGSVQLGKSIYRTLLAFTGDGQYVEPPNALTAIARFTGLLTTISALLGIFVIFFLERIKRVCGQWRRGHTVMIGVSEFALDYTERQGKVTVFDTKEALARVTSRARNSLFLADGMTDRTATGPSMGRTPEAVVFGSADGITNVERARIWLSGVSPERRKNTKLVLRIEDSSVARDLDLLSEDFAHATLISRGETIARSLVTGMAPTALAMIRGQARVHIALVGLGSTNLAIAEELALRCHHPDLGPLRLTIVDRAVEDAKARLRAERPDLLNPDFRPDGLEIEFLELDGLECCAEACAEVFLEKERELLLTAIVVAAGEDARNVAIAMGLRRLQLQELCLKAPIFVRSDSLASIAPERLDDLTGGLVLFGGRRLDAEDIELERIYNDLAEEIHNTWRDKLPPQNKTEANRWENLPTAERRSSYRAAMSTVEIYYAAGFVPTGDSALAGLRLENGAGNRTIGDDTLIDALSRKEHTRWMTERRLESYRAVVDGAPRDDEKKKHDLILPFEELPEDQPIKDERNVKAALTLGLERRERAPDLPCWRKALRIGVIGPLGITEPPDRASVDRLFDALRDTDVLLDEKALEVLTPNAPGYDRLAAIALAEAWRHRTGRACSILQFNAARVGFMDARAHWALGTRSPGLSVFEDQTAKLKSLKEHGHPAQDHGSPAARPIGRRSEPDARAVRQCH